MGAIEEGGKVAGGVVEGLKSQPLALALIVVNLLFLGAGAYVLNAVAGLGGAQNERKDALLSQLAKNCIIVTPKVEEPQP